MTYDEDPRERNICDYCEGKDTQECDQCEHKPEGEIVNDEVANFFFGSGVMPRLEDDPTLDGDMHLMGRVELERRTFPTGPAWEDIDPKKILEDLNQAFEEMNAGPLPVSDKYAKTAGREVSFCPSCGHRWWQPHQRKNLFGNHFARWECRPCNIQITRVSNESGVRELIRPLVIHSIPQFVITGTWTI